MKKTIWTHLVVKSWKDPNFKKRLMDNPAKTMKEEGFDIEEHAKVEIKESTDPKLVLYSPPSPENCEKLSDKELEKAAGAGPGTFHTTSILGGPPTCGMYCDG